MYAIRSGRKNADAPVYVDAATLGVYGKAGEVPGHPYSRLDPEKYGVKGSLATKCLQSTGVFVVFNTDSESLSLKWETSPLRVVGANTGATPRKVWTFTSSVTGVGVRGCRNSGYGRGLRPSRKKGHLLYARRKQGMSAVPASF